MRIGICGLGNLGLNLKKAFERLGFEVEGIDKKAFTALEEQVSRGCCGVRAEPRAAACSVAAGGSEEGSGLDASAAGGSEGALVSASGSAGSVSAGCASSLRSEPSLRRLDLVFLCVKDAQIAKTAEMLSKIFVGVPMLHCSGSTSIEVFGKEVKRAEEPQSVACKNFGVFYPLQTFSKEDEVCFGGVNVLIEANNDALEKKLFELAKALGANPIKADSRERKKLHIAAIFSCNYSNLMYSIAEDILKDSNLDFELLLPLIKKTASKVEKFSPHSVQTGPAARGDMELVQDHILFLKEIREEYSEIYKKLAQNIVLRKRS